MPSTSTPGPRSRSRARRLIAGSVAAGLTVTGLTVATSQGAGAATTPLAQSVGRFLDGSLGGNPIQQLADVKDARAVAPGSQSTQNPLDATLLNKLSVPLTGALQLPSLAGITLGAANQVAVAQTSGFSYGASGAVQNSGGVSVGGNNAAYPADSTIDLSGNALGGSTIPIPGGTSASALGGLKVKLGAVSALAQTPTGVGKAASTNYNIAGLSLELGSPALGQLLSTLSSALNPTSVISSLTSTIGNLLPALPPGCALSQGNLPTTLNLANGAVVIDGSTATLTVNVAALLQTLGLDLNSLPANTDLLGYVVNYLTSPDGLAKGLQSLLNSAVQQLVNQYDACKAALQAIPVLGPVINTLVQDLMQGRDTLTNAVNGLVGSLSGFGGTGNPLAPLGDALAKVVAIGVNVQPNGAAGTFSSKLRATPDQATGVVAGQTIVRAIEVDLLGGQVAALSLANAAAGPSAAAPVTPAASSSVAATSAAPTDIPTKINAGEVTGGGSPAAPLVLLTLGFVLAGAGAVAWKVRGRHVL